LAAAVKPNATFVTILREPNSLFHSMYRWGCWTFR
jgi:hypothetical protein